MDTPSDSGAPPSAADPADGRLDSWKEIAAYLRRDVTTVQRWEKREGMPVHRHLHDKIGSVYAFRSDLDAWTRSRHANAVRESGVGTESGPLEETAAPSPPPGDRDLRAGTGPAVSPPPEQQGVSGRRPAVWLVAMGAAFIASAGTAWLFLRAPASPADPIANARHLALTDFDGAEQSAALSPDGRFVAFLSDRDGGIDLWLTQVGSGTFHQLTHGLGSSVVNPSVRSLGFTPDGSSVTFWRNRAAGSGTPDIGIWAVPILGGEPRPYLEGVAEFDWTRDGSRLVYHTAADGDPTFIREQGEADDRRLMAAPPGVHIHFPTWSQDHEYIYYVRGTVPDQMDVWRIPVRGGAPEQITHHNSYVSHPVFADDRTLLYLATDSDGSGPRLHRVDVDRRVPQPVSSGIERYTSLASAADRRRFVVTQTRTRHTFWRVPVLPDGTAAAVRQRVPLATTGGFFPRLGPGYLVYVVSNGDGDSIWKLQGTTATELWSAPGAQVVAAPAIDADGRRIAFTVRQGGQTRLYVTNADATDVRAIASSLALQGAPTWMPNGRSVTSAVVDGLVPRLFDIPLDGGAPAPIVEQHSQDPQWSPDGTFVLFSGPDIGTTFRIEAAAGGREYRIPELTLARGARHVEFLPGGRAIVFLRGAIGRENLWSMDVTTGRERQLTDLPSGFDVSDFDVSPDGRDIILEQVEDQSDIVLMDLGPQ